MSDLTPNDAANQPVSLTLQIEPRVYEAFQRKAQQANMDVETFLSNTLTIVLGCRVFNETYSCSPILFAKKTVALQTAEE